MTLTKAFAERRLNLVGWVPMVLGAVCLLARRRWFTDWFWPAGSRLHVRSTPDRGRQPDDLADQLWLGRHGSLVFGLVIQSCLDRSRAGGRCDGSP